MKGKDTNDKNHVFAEVADLATQTSEPLWFRAVIEFTQAIARQMRVQGLTRLQLAQRLAVHPSFITKVLKGDTNISVETIAKFAHALQCEFHIDVKQTESFVSGAFAPIDRKQITGGAATGAPPPFSQIDRSRAPQLSGLRENGLGVERKTSHLELIFTE
jgi:transcriptional regulator with XRE-family HTH domain